MKTSPLTFLLPILIFISCKSPRTDTVENEFRQNNPSFASDIENKIKALYSENKIVGDFLFAVVTEEGLAYSFALDSPLLNGESAHIGIDTPVYIASATKSFTGTLLKIMEENKEIDLNRSLHQYLPELNFSDSINTEKISIKSLLNHTHGTFSTPLVWKTAFLGYSGKNAELIKDLNSDFLHDPSGNFRYSNVGPILAATVAEKVTGNSWKDEMDKNIFSPLEMNNTGAYVSDFSNKDILPSISFSEKHGIIDKGFYKEDITMHASGGIISTINDLSKWLSANIREDEILLSKEAWKDLHLATTNQNKKYFTYDRTGYSLGWDIAQYQENIVLTRFGGLAGISFHISYMPEKKIGIIAFSNDSRAYILPHLIANYAYNQINNPTIADSIFLQEEKIFEKSFERENNIEYKTKDEILHTSKKNDQITGTYYNDLGWPEIEIKEMNNQYLLKWGVLNGIMYKDEAVNSYEVNLGPLRREFMVKNGSIKTGSLIYNKREN